MERAVKHALKTDKAPGAGAAASVELTWGHTLHHIDDLPFSVAALPNGFTPFKNKVEARSAVRALLPTPAAGGLPLPADRAAFAAWGVEPSLAARGGAPRTADGRAGGGFPPPRASSCSGAFFHTVPAARDLAACCRLRRRGFTRPRGPQALGMPAAPEDDPRAALKFEGGAT